MVTSRPNGFVQPCIPILAPLETAIGDKLRIHPVEAALLAGDVGV
jgi:hypothetical protein